MKPAEGAPDVRVACVGAGYFSGFHRDAWSRIAGTELVGVCDTNIEAANGTGLPGFGALKDMIDATAPDILDVIVPPESQAEVIRRALALGLRRIICQKPFCTSLDEAEAVTAQAEAAGAILVIHENFRFMPWYRAIKAALDEGSIGTLHQATFRLRPGDGQGPDAYLDRQPYFQTMPRFLVQETAVHWVDTFRFLLGDPVSVYADLRRLNPSIAGEDAGLIIFEYEQGVRAVFDGNRHLDHASDNLRRTMGEALFEGTEGTLTLLGDGAVMHRAFGSCTARTVLPPDPWPGFGGDCVFALQSHIVAALKHGAVPENTAPEYCAVLRARDAIYRSAETGRKVPL